MPTSKMRIQISIEGKVLKCLERLASRRKISLASLTSELVEEGLEIQEDAYFSRAGDRVFEMLDEGKLISHADVWK